MQQNRQHYRSSSVGCGPVSCFGPLLPCGPALKPPIGHRALPMGTSMLVPPLVRHGRTTWYSRPEDGLQFFKEDKIEGAVYDVYLKKVRYHTASDEVDSVVPATSGSGARYSNPSSTFYSNLQEDDKRATLQWRLEEVRVIRCGTVQRLVEALSSDSGELDSSYVDTFLATYRTFSTAYEVMTLQLERYKALAEDSSMKQHLKEGHLRCIRLVILGWLDTYPEDFHEPPSYRTLMLLKDFALSQLTDSSLAERLKKKIEKLRQIDDTTISTTVEDITLEFGFSMQSSTYIGLNTRSLTHSYDLLTTPSREFAEQLTYIDAELFKKVIPYQCLGSCWSRRNNRKNGSSVGSVYATVNQFNVVSYRVIATLLKSGETIGERARILEKWIEIAQELRILKNFSSLKAIISALQSTSVFRLTRVWALVSKPKLALFLELAEIFSEQNNQQMVREVMYREGTAKFADPETVNSVRGRKNSGTSWGLSSMNKVPSNNRRVSMFETADATIIQGTVPYLGIFLTDLTMIDTAFSDTVNSDLINFEKHRKEFEVLTQIKLLQGSAARYRIKQDPTFGRYLMNLRVYDDNESYDLSCEIQPDSNSAETTSQRHRRRSSLGFFTVRGGRPSSTFYTEDNTGSLSLLRPPELDDQSLRSLPGAILTKSKKPKTRPSLRQSASLGSLFDDPSLPKPRPGPGNNRGIGGGDKSSEIGENIVAKIFYEGTGSDQTNQYKGILITNMDRTHNVIKTALQKYALPGTAEDYCLYQRLENDREQMVPEKTNVFYAVGCRSTQVNFVLRRKSASETSLPPKPRKKR